MFRIFIFAIIMLIIFIGAYKLISHLLQSRIEKRLFKQHNPGKTWHSVYKPAGIVAASLFAMLTFYLVIDTQYLLATISVIFTGASFWIYRRC